MSNEAARRVTRTDANGSRNRRRQEIAYLRDAVAQLESELGRRRASCQSTERPQKTQNALQIDEVWKDIAVRQRALRYHAEVENTKLRTKVEEQLRLVKSLRRLLHKRRYQGVEWVVQPRDVAFMASSSTEKISVLDAGAVDGMLKAGIPPLLAQAECVFAKNDHFKQNTGPFRHIELQTTDEEGAFIETTERRCLPFDRHVMSDGLMAQFGDALERFADVEDNDDTIIKDMISTIDTARFRGQTRSKVALRREHRAKMTVIVINALSDPWTATGSTTDGIYVRHHVWFRIEELCSTSSSSKPLTQVCTYHKAIPEVYGAVSDQKRKVGALTNFLLATLGFQMDVARDSVDNWLLTRAMTTSQASSLERRNVAIS